MTPRPAWQLAIFTAAAMLLMVVLRVLYGTITELNQGQEALSRGDDEAALTHFERTLHWYLPFGPWSDEAAQQLWTLGERSEKRGDAPRAMLAYEAIRSGFLATRSFYTPSPHWIARANERIAALQVADPQARWPDRNLPEDQRKAVALTLLQRDDAPHPGWSAMAVFGFLGWVGAGLGFFWRGFDPEGHFQPRAGLRYGLGILLGYALWVIGLMRA